MRHIREASDVPLLSYRSPLFLSPPLPYIPMYFLHSYHSAVLCFSYVGLTLCCGSCRPQILLSYTCSIHFRQQKKLICYLVQLDRTLDSWPRILRARPFCIQPRTFKSRYEHRRRIYVQNKPSLRESWAGLMIRTAFWSLMVATACNGTSRLELAFTYYKRLELMLSIRELSILNRGSVYARFSDR